MTFDKRIKILRSKKDGVGSFAKTMWEPDKELWANWVKVDASEAVTSDSVQSTKSAIVTVRYGNYSSTIDETLRIRYKGIDYEIISVDNVDEQNRKIEMRVKATVNG